jgi:outer membrane receptor protein involved in Fe transport
MTTQSNQILRRAVRMALFTGGAAAAGVVHPSIAQAQAAADATAESTEALKEVVVTGSRISSPNIQAISPITTISSDEFKEQGATRVEDLLNSLPQVVADQSSGLSMGSNGTANINLRGLGVQRTLVLINGRRLMGGDPGAGEPSGSNLGYASAADINQIPVALIERVDVLTGGASATYGADAVAGVVNFVMNDHFEGVRVDANVGIYNHNNHESWIDPLLTANNFPAVTGSNWDGSNKDFTIITGHNFADGAGNFEGYISYMQTAPIQADHRDHSACVLDNGYEASSGANFGPYSCGGSVNAAPAVIANPSTFQFYQVCDPSKGCPGASGTLAGLYNEYNYAASHYLQRLDERYNGGFFAHLKLNDHAEAYSEFMFMDDETRGNYAPAGLFFGSGFATAGGLRDGNWYVNCGVGAYGNAGMNPYLTASEYGQICAPGSALAAGGTAPQPGDTQLLMARRNIEGGPREDEYDHQTFRGVFGTRGDITANWSYDTSLTYGVTRFSDYHNNDTSASRMQDAMLAVRDPTTGQIVCRSGNSGCVPWNIWNPAIAITPQQLAYFSVPGFVDGTNTEQVVTAYTSGDLSNWVKLPTANQGLKVVFGTEFRRETEEFHPDEEFITADLAGEGSPTLPFAAGYHVWEGFTEFNLPLVEDKPGVKSLDFESKYRYSKYNSGFDTNTYEFGVSWSPVSDVRARASYNRAVRVPNVAELYKPDFVALDSGGDICAGTKFTAAQCAQTTYGMAIAVPTPESPAGQYNGLTGGNPNVKPEVGKTIDVGLVFTPSFVPSFSATLDYADIKILNLITSYGPNLIQTNCILSGSATSSWCEMVHRDPNGTLWASPQGYTIDPLLNLGSIENESVDIGLAYRLSMGAWGALRSRFDGTYLVKLVTTPGGGVAPYNCAGKFGPDCEPVTPKWRHRMTVDWQTPVTGLGVGATWRFFGSARNTLLDPSVAEDYVGAATIAADGPPPDASVSTISYLDLHASYVWNKITIRVGANNVLDKDPPTIATESSGGNSVYAESNTFPSVYDMAGRYLYLNLTMDF